MKIQVEYKDEKGTYHNLIETINNFGLLKHLAIAGQHYLPTLQEYIRIAGIFLRFIEYLDKTALSNSSFSEPPAIRRDPTEKAEFSTLVGKGIADFLSKKLSKAKVTHSYEAAMTLKGLKIKGKRPDLYCFGDKFQFAVEAKGYSKAYVNSKEMLIHKNQAVSGPLPVNFSIASVSYNLFNNVSCKYHDPFVNNIEYDNRLYMELNRIYYSGIFEYLDNDLFDIEEGELEGNHCFFIDILGSLIPFCVSSSERICLILQTDFKRFLRGENVFFNDTIIQNENYYLDTDGIGFGSRTFKKEKHNFLMDINPKRKILFRDNLR
jgi:hypothetical protein